MPVAPKSGAGIYFDKGVSLHKLKWHPKTLQELPHSCNRRRQGHHSHGGPFSTKSKKRDTRQQSTVMKLNTLVTMVLLIRFTLSFLWFAVECGQKGHRHGQLDER
jgi:hypothetical protein